MPVKKKPATAKRRKRRATAAKPATRKKTAKRRKRRTTAAHATTKRRRRRAKASTSAATKRPRKKATAKRRKTKTGVKHKRKTAVRKKPRRKVAVKKKPSESKASKGTSKSSRTRVNRELRALKKIPSESSTMTKATQVGSKKKRKQVKSDSQAHPVIEQQLSLEVKMVKPKKLRKRVEKQALLPEKRQESISSSTEIGLNLAPYKERPGEDYMSGDQQAHFRRLLLQRKHMLLEDMGRTVHHLQDEGASLPDISDRATQEEEFNLELRARDRERKLIKKIEDALQQLDEGRYGFCNSCGVEIGIRRLEARPTATLCIDCKTLDEIREKQMGG
jgi:DnaK suppressor protein